MTCCTNRVVYNVDAMILVESIHRWVMWKFDKRILFGLICPLSLFFIITDMYLWIICLKNVYLVALLFLLLVSFFVFIDISLHQNGNKQRGSVINSSGYLIGQRPVLQCDN